MTATTTEQAVSTTGKFHRTKPYTPTRSLCGVPITFALERKPIADVPDADRCRRCWSRPDGARLERSSLQQRQGIRATADGGVCDRCDGAILKDERIVKHGERWGHAGCWAGDHE